VLLSAPGNETQIVTRCAWCERYAIGGRWLPESALRPGPGRPVAVTHGICPDCAAAVQERR
jgi:NMD protein affecting ribosome stability and mRNA decay